MTIFPANWIRQAMTASSRRHDLGTLPRRGPWSLVCMADEGAMLHWNLVKPGTKFPSHRLRMPSGHLGSKFVRRDWSQFNSAPAGHQDLGNMGDGDPGIEPC